MSIDREMEVSTQLKDITENRIRELHKVYKSERQIGLVVGAGVTGGADVPLYKEMVLKLCKKFKDEKLLRPEAPLAVFDFLEEKKSNLESLQITPEEIALFLKTSLDENLVKKKDLMKKLREVCYTEEIRKRKKNVPNRLYAVDNMDTTTLQSVICFCAAKSGSRFFENPDIQIEKGEKPKHQKPRIETNPKVGGILTTNYDNLLEATCNSKFGNHDMLKSVGRVTSRESKLGKRIIPVYHIHGFVHFALDRDDPSRVKASDTVVIAQDDYFERFYDPLGFSNYVAMSFLRRFPSIFIGTAMKDLNIRRFLYHLRKERGVNSDASNYYAIIKATETPQDYFTDSILEFYGVNTIWIKKFAYIKTILKDLYSWGNEELEKEWDYLWNFKWWQPSPQPNGKV